MLDTIWQLHIKRVIPAAYWNGYLPPVPDTILARLLDPYSPRGSLGAGNDAENKRAFDDALKATIRSLQNLGVEIWLADQVPVFAIDCSTDTPSQLADSAYSLGVHATASLPQVEYSLNAVPSFGKDSATQIAELSDRLKISAQEVGEIYRREFDRLAAEARIPAFLEILAMSITRSTLRDLKLRRDFQRRVRLP